MKKRVVYSLVVASVIFAAPARAEKVEVTLSDNLDGYLSGYCIDIKGGNRNVDPANGLQAHTCYSYRGELGTDQIFETDRFADNILYMPEFDVCAELSGLEAGSTVGLGSCNGSDLQSFVFYGGTIRPRTSADMCLTAGLGTSLGRGGTSKHQIKTLTLERCSDDMAAFQQWRTRATAD